MSKSRILISILSLVLILGLLVPGFQSDRVSAAGVTLTLRYFINNGGSGESVAVDRVEVTAPGGFSAAKDWVNGTAVFTVPDGVACSVKSKKGALSRTDSVAILGATIWDIPCGKLTLLYDTNNDGTGDKVAADRVDVLIGTAGVIAKDWVNGAVSFALLQTPSGVTFDIKSKKGAQSRTDSGYALSAGGETPYNIPCGKLTLLYDTNNDGTGDKVAVDRVDVLIGTAGVIAKDWVNGAVSFALLQTPSGVTFDIKSKKGALSRTDSGYALSAGGETPYNIPCGKLTLLYDTNNDGTGDKVAVDRVDVLIGTAGVIAKDWVNGAVSFALLQTPSGVTFDVKSKKGALSRTDSGYALSAGGETPYNIPCGKLTITYYANGKIDWPMKVDRVDVLIGTAGVIAKDWVNGAVSFALLQTPSGVTFDVKSKKGASSRLESGVSLGATNTVDVPVARFRVAAVKADFTAQSVDRVDVLIGSAGVDAKDWVTSNVDFSLFQSDGTGGAGPYTFRAKKGTAIAQTSTSANKYPPAGLSGVILMLP